MKDEDKIKEQFINELEELHKQISELKTSETKCKRAEEALRESEMINRSLLEGSPVCNKIIDLDSKLRYMSAAGIKHLKIPDIKPYYGQTYPPEFYPESMRAPLIKGLELARAGKISSVEAPVHDMEGNVVWYHTTFVPAFDDDGQVKYIIGTSVDITERKKFEDALKRSEEKYRSLIENAGDAVISITEDFIVSELNKKAEGMLGYSRDEVLGKPIHFLLSPGEREKSIEQIEAFKKSRELKQAGTTIEREFLRKDGSTFIAECATFAVELQGEYVFTAFIRDTTERREMEEKLLQSEKLKSLGELAGGVAHDFNNVLAAILGNAQLLKMSIDPLADVVEGKKIVDELKHGLGVIEKAAKDGAETVKRIQEFARTRDEDKYFIAVNINEVIADALNFTRMRWKGDAESKGIKINLQKELTALPSISGSGAELREVIVNLINNAIDTMPQGGDLKIKTFSEDGQVCIRVEDTGDGIPSDRKHRIFDPFFTTKGVQSSGLGLSVSYGIINSHRGTISVDSVEGEGTTFTIKLPVSDGVIEEEKEKAVQFEHRKAKILVIEDEEQVRDLLSAILIQGGHEVETATGGHHGIEVFEKKEFDLVFTDLGMSVMSGWKVAEKVKSINEKVPVALITGWNIELKESELKKSGVDFIVQKPFEVNQVLRLVQEGMMLRDKFKTD